MRTAMRMPPMMYEEVEQTRKELKAALLPESDVKDCIPWEEMRAELREKFGV